VAATKEKMKWLIAGGDGQLGSSMKKALTESKIEFLALSRSEMDITDLSQVKEIIEESCADVIVNAAAYTNVEKAESERDTAFLINETGTRNLAIASRECNSKFLHFSTDYVFSGSGNIPWQINSPTKPLSIYGQSKLAGEKAIQQEYVEGSLIIRTAWLYSQFGKNFYKTLLKMALENNDPVKVVSDQIGQPTSTVELAGLAIEAIANEIPAGTYHATNSGHASWYDFALQIFELAGVEPGRVIAVATSEYQAKAPRPQFSALKNSKWLELGVKPLSHWQESVINAFPAISKSMS
jgi:dTDP-4-dehydrorhamnose reductase